MAGWLKALLFLLGLMVAAAGTGYVTGLFDPWFAPKTAQVASGTTPPASSESTEKSAGHDVSTANEAADQDTQTDEEPVLTTDKQDRLRPPTFDILRVEPDGSVLVAGKAGSGALVELLSGAQVLGSATAGDEGDFVIVLDDRLSPGDYQLSLRATMPDKEVLISSSSAVVSIPQQGDEDQVLAMIDEPGAPAQLITAPQAQAEKPAQETAASDEVADEMASGSDSGQVADESAGATEDADEAKEIDTVAAPSQIVSGEADEDTSLANTTPQESPAAPQPDLAAAGTVVVEAVEIEGDTIFVAGRATPLHGVRVYADAQMLGETIVSEGGRFLVEAKRNLAVGNYMIRADLIGKDGTVLARAAVPFAREPGEAIAAVAPPAASSDVVPAAEGGEVAAADSQAEAAPEDAPASAPESAPLSQSATNGDATIAPTSEAATAAPLQRADGAVIIRRGDSLWRISRRVYGHGIRYSTIYLANQDQISDPDRIWPGQVFALPHETPEGEQADLEAIGDQSVEPQAQQPAAQ